MLKAKLIVVGGDAKAGEVGLRLPCIIGRGKEATLTLPHPLVSRQHCEITEKDGKLLVRDMGSMNGTYVNNKRIEGVETLEPDQLLTLGNVTFRAFYEVGEQVPVGEQVSAPPVEKTAAQEINLRQPVKTEPAGQPEQAVDDRETVYDDAANASDTDKSLPSIEIPFEEVESPIESVKSQSASEPMVKIDDSTIQSVDPVELSAIDGLPTESAEAISFKGKVLGSDVVQTVEASSLDLEIEEDPKLEKEEALNSFLNKLPR